MFYYKNVNSYVNAYKRDPLIRNGDETFNKPLSVMIKIASVDPLICVTRDITVFPPHLSGLNFKVKFIKESTSVTPLFS